MWGVFKGLHEVAPGGTRSHLAPPGSHLGSPGVTSWYRALLHQAGRQWCGIGGRGRSGVEWSGVEWSGVGWGRVWGGETLPQKEPCASPSPPLPRHLSIPSSRQAFIRAPRHSLSMTCSLALPPDCRDHGRQRQPRRGAPELLGGAGVHTSVAATAAAAAWH